MASLKEIKVRIASIRSTQKITAAMKMVSSAKLHHTQTLTEHTLLYANKLSAILNGLLEAECNLESSYTEKREVKQVQQRIMRHVQCQRMERAICPSA